jgi:Domain of unknown function (DUF4188)
MPEFTRLTTERDKDLVVFLIGMRVNRLLAIHQWFTVFLTMLPMMREIQADPDSGLLGASTWISRREIMIVQYWDTYDQLVAYATSSTKKHRRAWNNFNQRRGRAAKTVGVFHETYVVAPDRMETIYDAMPPILLGNATRAAAVSRSRNSSRERLRGPGRQLSTTTDADFRAR